MFYIHIPIRDRLHSFIFYAGFSFGLSRFASLAGVEIEKANIHTHTHTQAHKPTLVDRCVRVGVCVCVYMPVSLLLLLLLL